MSLNIGGDKNDPTYRYKMPPMTTKVEGRGNGIKTVIVNMSDVAKSLHVHPAYPTKFFGIELGAQSKYTPSTERAVVNGAHNGADLAKLMDKFISQFILCPTCKLPELKMTVKNAIKIDCAACGHNSVINSQHRLLQYISRNPPNTLGGDKDKDKKKKSKSADSDDEGGDNTERKKKGGKKEHKGGKKKKKDENDEDNSSDDTETVSSPRMANGNATEEVNNDAETQSKASSKAEKTKKKEKTEEEEIVWHTDTSKEAQRARKDDEFREARQAAEKLTSIATAAHEGEDKPQDSPVASLRFFVSEQQRTPSEVYSELKRMAYARGLDEKDKIRIVFGTFMTLSTINDDRKLIPSLFHNNAELLKYFTKDRLSALTFLSVFEQFVGETDTRFLAYVPHILKKLYEEDVLDESYILLWYDSSVDGAWFVNKDIATTVREKAKVFCEWLKEADSDDDEDEDED